MKLDHCKNLNNIDLLDSWLIQCAIIDAMSIHTRNKNNKNKVIFGGKVIFYKRLQNKISKEEFKLNRLFPLTIQGEELQKGNRKFKLDIIDNNQIIFKLNRKEHIEIKLPNLRNNIKNDLIKLQTLNEIKHLNKGHTFCIKLDDKNIYISFEEFKSEIKTSLISSKYIGIDMNPNYIGISICDFINGKEQILHTQLFDLSKITKELVNLNVSSSNLKFKKLNNKLNFETIEISKAIANLFKHYKCKFIFIEDLQFKNNKKQYKIFNRLTKNLWKREKFTQNLNKRINILGGKLFEIFPQYTSFIGNIKYDYPDPINASLEIGRREYEIIILKNKKFYPKFNSTILKDQWKKYFDIGITTWIEYFNQIKNLKLKYRVSLDECTKTFKVFSLSSAKSKIFNYNFYS